MTAVTDAKVLPVQLIGDLITNGYMSKIKNWILLIHFVTLEIQSVLEVVVILVLSREFNVRGVSFGNSCQYQLHVFFCTPHVSKYTAYTSVLSCYTVRVGHPVSTTC